MPPAADLWVMKELKSPLPTHCTLMMCTLSPSSSIPLLQEQEWQEVVFCLGSSIVIALQSDIAWSHPCCSPMGTVAQPGWSCAARDSTDPATELCCAVHCHPRT